ncbi:Short C-terminal domain [Desulfitobacterium hafniense]|uniref:Short C-terminal domain n=1 Tax=Desulfitobacterium hafniense TaxID=49338 RepID=A0A098B8T5_DESHA|nr:SHOCT domain-containing protein [Desulfitobacterium hafniense]CDX04787.1 Short C-terminal domain [Desulfitobacterium hafniense]
MMMWGYGPWGGYGWMGTLMAIVFWGLIIWLCVSLFRRNRGSHRRDDALNILRERYARGEIDSEEFDRRKEDLKRYC